MKLLSREQFKVAVFNRDKHICVMCGGNAEDAHHIIDRSLFGDGGYYLDNGSSLCGKCHVLAEATVYSCEQIREECGIVNIILPDHFYSGYKYTKWGDIIIGDSRIPGEMFCQDNVQKILGQYNMLKLYQDHIYELRTKYVQ